MPSCWTCRAAVCRFGNESRAPIYEKINAEAEADIKELLGLGDDYCVLFMGGGASLQFSMVPMNFLGAGQTAGLCREPVIFRIKL